MLVHPDDSWMVKALCRITPNASRVFFPDRHQGDYTVARQVCGKCPVKVHCLAYALYHREQYGMWGGLSPSQRRAIPLDKRRKLRQWWTSRYGRR